MKYILILMLGFLLGAATAEYSLVDRLLKNDVPSYLQEFDTKITI